MMTALVEYVEGSRLRCRYRQKGWGWSCGTLGESLISLTWRDAQGEAALGAQCRSNVFTGGFSSVTLPPVALLLMDQRGRALVEEALPKDKGVGESGVGLYAS